jgi:hypothetical protein
MKLKKLIFTVALTALITFSAIGQELLTNQLTVDGKTYKLEGKDPMTYTEKKGEWWLMYTATNENKEGIAVAIRTKGKFLSSGNYPMTPNVGKIPEGKVSYSISISSGNTALGMLGYKQYTSTDKGTAVVSNENGIYSFTFYGVEGINIRAQKFLVDGNMTFDPNAHKTRKELNRENKDLNMSAAWTNEVKYFLSQSKRFSAFNDMNKESASSETRDMMKETIEKMIESNEEILKILSRTNDKSLTNADISSYKTIAMSKSEQLSQTKKEIKKSINHDIMSALILGLTRGAKE